MIFSQKEARVDINPSRASKDENKWIFDWLHKQREVIEADFGAPMEWLRMEDKKASGIRFRKEFDGYDREKWPEMIEWMTDHVKRSEKAFSPRLALLRKEMKAGIPSDLNNSDSSSINQEK